MNLSSPLRVPKSNHRGNPMSGTSQFLLRSEQGSTLAYSMMLLGVMSTLVYINASKAENFAKWDSKLHENAFNVELLAEMSTKVSCPEGVIKISAGTCTGSPSLKLSNKYYRDKIEKAIFDAAATYTPIEKQQAISGMIFTRIECYRRQSTIDPYTGKQYVTPKGERPCDAIRTPDLIDPKVVTFPAANSLLAGAENLITNFDIVTNIVLPAIDKKSNETDALLAPLYAAYNVQKPLYDTAKTKFTSSDTAAKNSQTDYDKALADQKAAQTSADNAQKDFDAAVAACKPFVAPTPCPTQGKVDSTQTALTKEQSDLTAAKKVLTDAQTALTNANNTLNTSKNNLATETTNLNQLVGKINPLQTMSVAYDSMTAFLNEVIKQSYGIISQSQISAMQKSGGYLKTQMVEGTTQGNKNILDNMPKLQKDGAIIGNPPAESDSFKMRFMTIDPYCEHDPKNPNGVDKLFKFRAKVDEEQINALPNSQDRIQVFQTITKMLYGSMDASSITKAKTGVWAPLPENVIPNNCKIVEQLDPSIKGIGAIDDTPI